MNVYLQPGALLKTMSVQPLSGDATAAVQTVTMVRQPAQKRTNE